MTPGLGLSPAGSSSIQLQPPNSTLPEERCRSTAVLPPEAIANLENSPSIIPRRLSLLRIKMATAKFKSHFHAPHGHKLFRSNSSNLANEKPIDEEQKQKEKNFIACFECNGPPLSPSQIAENPRSKEVGAASKQLRVGDFELIKTIGTGEFAMDIPNPRLIPLSRYLCACMAVLFGRVPEGGAESFRSEDTPQGR